MNSTLLTNKTKFVLAMITTLVLSIPTTQAQSNCDIYCPNDFAVIANSNGEYIVEDYFALNYVTLEECSSGAVVTQSPSPGTVMTLGEFEVIMTVSSEGETDDCDFDVAVIEEQTGDCDFDCPENQFGTADATGNYTIPDYATNGALVVTGDCGDYTYEQDPVAGTQVAAGTYFIDLSAENEAGTSTISCTFELLVENSLDTSDFTSNAFAIYPNPATEVINFSTEVDSAKIITLTGKMLQQTTTTRSLDLTPLQNGLYLLRLQKDNRVLIKKIMKQ